MNTVKTATLEIRLHIFVAMVANTPEYAGVFGIAGETSAMAILVTQTACGHALKGNMPTVQATAILSYSGDAPEQSMLDGLEMLAPGLSLRLMQA